MNKNRLKKIVLLSSISTMLLSGCRDNNVQSNDSTKVITTEVATVEECAGPTEAKEINSTIENKKKEYEELTNNKLDESNLFVDRFPQINYLWKDKEGNYIYDYRINLNPLDIPPIVSCHPPPVPIICSISITLLIMSSSLYLISKNS